MPPTPKLTKREKFDKRLDTFPANTVVSVLIFTDSKADIAGWSIGVYNKIEGAHEHIDISEEQPE